MSAILLDGKYVSNCIKKSIKKEIEEFKRPLHLAIIKTSDDPASATYIKGKIKDCSECGIANTVYDLCSATKDKVFETLSIVYYNKAITGVIVQLPLREDLQQYKDLIITGCINPNKDVDCFTPINLYKLSSSKNCKLAPCTPAGIIELLKYYNIEISGKHCVIVGRSDIVGKPLATMMCNNNATVTLCHSKTNDLQYYTKQADILVSAVGKEKLITADMVKDGATVIDVGINRNSEGKLCGDVDFENVRKVAKYITPVPGGVGLMTRAMLMKNVLIAATENLS